MAGLQSPDKSSEGVQQTAVAVDVPHPESSQYLVNAEAAGINPDGTAFMDHLAADPSIDTDVADDFFAHVPGVAGEAPPSGDALAQELFAGVPAPEGGLAEGVTLGEDDVTENAFNDSRDRAAEQWAEAAAQNEANAVQPEQVQDTTEDADTSPGADISKNQGFAGGVSSYVAREQQEPSARPDFSNVSYGGEWNANQMVGETSLESKIKVGETVDLTDAEKAALNQTVETQAEATEQATAEVASESSSPSTFERQQEVMDRIKELNDTIQTLEDRLAIATDQTEIDQIESALFAAKGELATAEAESAQLAAETKAELAAVGEEATSEVDVAVEQATSETMKNFEQMTVAELKEFIQQREALVGMLNFLAMLVEKSNMSPEGKQEMEAILAEAMGKLNEAINAAKNELNSREAQQNQFTDIESLLADLMNSFESANLSESDRKEMSGFMAFLQMLLRMFNGGNE